MVKAGKSIIADMPVTSSILSLQSDYDVVVKAASMVWVLSATFPIGPNAHTASDRCKVDLPLNTAMRTWALT